MTVKLFLGLPGTGKTQAMIDFIALDLREKEEKRHLFFAVDRAAEWGTHVDGTPNPRWRGNAPERTVIAPNPDKFEEWLSNDNIEEGLPESGLVLFRAPWEGLDVARWSILLGGIVYVDDEIDLVAVYEKWKENPLREIIHRGRHLPNAQGVPCQAHIMGAGRRCENLHSDITSMADEVLVFRVSGKHTRKRILDEGFVSEEQETDMITQPNLHYFIWRNTGDVGKGKLDNPFKAEKPQTEEREDNGETSSED